MSFKVGDKVVYPHHGAAVIEKRETKVAFGEKRMLQRARQSLVSELTVALNVDEETAEERLNEALT